MRLLVGGAQVPMGPDGFRVLGLDHVTADLWLVCSPPRALVGHILNLQVCVLFHIYSEASDLVTS